MPRGCNKNSHNNKPKLNTIQREIGLAPEQWEAVKVLGGGSYSKGARQAIALGLSLSTEDTQTIFSKLPILGQAKLAILMLLEGSPEAREMAEGLLFDLEDLEIENIYLDSEIEPPKGAYIV